MWIFSPKIYSLLDKVLKMWKKTKLRGVRVDRNSKVSTTALRIKISYFDRKQKFTKKNQPRILIIIQCFASQNKNFESKMYSNSCDCQRWVSGKHIGKI